MAITRAQALNAKGKPGKVDLGTNYVYGTFVDVHSGGNHVKLSRGGGYRFKDTWHHRDQVFIHGEEGIRVELTTVRASRKPALSLEEASAAVGQRAHVAPVYGLPITGTITEFNAAGDWILLEREFFGRIEARWYRRDVVRLGEGKRARGLAASASQKR